MRALLLLFITSSLAAQILPTSRRIASPKPAAGCTVATADTLNESFEGAGDYAWSETNTPDGDAALPGTSPCSGLGSECCSFDYSGATSDIITWDRTSTKSSGSEYYRFYIHLTDQTFGSSDVVRIFQTTESSSSPSYADSPCMVEMVESSGSIYLRAKEGNGSSTSNVLISEDAWYRVEVKWTYNTASTGVVLRVYDSGGSQIGSDVSCDSKANWGIRYVHFGLFQQDNANSATMVIDGIGFDSSDWLGQ